MATEDVGISFNVVDMDDPFVIDPKTKTIRFEPGEKVLAQHSKKSERFSFYISKKVVEGYDLSLCNSVLVHYQNIDEKTKQVSAGVYSVKDLNIDIDNSVSFSWLLDPDATEYVGALIFSVHFSYTDETGKVVYNFPTLTYSGVTVGETIWNSETIAKEYPDIIAAFDARIKTLETYGGGAIYYSEKTDFTGISATRIPKAATASWTSVGFHAEPKEDDLVISATSQLFKVMDVSSTYLTMRYLADLGGGSADVFYVTGTFSDENSGRFWCTADKTMAEIFEAHKANREVKLIVPYEDHEIVLNLVLCTELVTAFYGVVGTGTIGNDEILIFSAIIDDDSEFWFDLTGANAVADDHINSLIDAKLGVIENGTY